MTQDDQRRFNLRLINALDGLNIPYAIGGSFAAMAYSEPRLTNDIDIMIIADVEELSRLVDEVTRWEIYISPLECILETDLPLGLPINVVDGSLKCCASWAIRLILPILKSGRQKSGWKTCELRCGTSIRNDLVREPDQPGMRRYIPLSRCISRCSTRPRRKVATSSLKSTRTRFTSRSA